jgi:class 3 adenylate cyclase/tetratricopeptide (TPR) repeat protein
LADKILLSRGALEGERKQVTVLFADLKGSMEMLADRDPEEARRLLDPVLERMMEAVHRYEGTVNQVMGDGIMALFGAPIAHEDHAVRACYAALRMQEQVQRYAESARHRDGVNVQIRVGLNSGEVVVRAIGSDLRMDYTAVGQTTHLAARMEQFASPGSIVLTSATLELVEGFVAVKSLGPVPVKGLADPVEVYEITGAGPARTRMQAVALRGLTRFVGRDAELELLRRVQGLAGAGRGQVVAAVGEAGVGKSRLVYEFTHSHRLQGWQILESASVSYGKATSYLPVIDLLRGYFKITDRDDQSEIREKVTGKLLALDRALEPDLPAMLALLDVPVDDVPWRAMDPAQRRQRTLEAVKHLLIREAREQPVVVIFEDLHWIDRETQALLDSLVESMGSVRLLLFVNYRPEYQHGWTTKTYYSRIRLDALPAESAEVLLSALLGDEPALTPLKSVLVRRGNPFFLEETVRTLVETKVLVGERGRYHLTRSLEAIQVPPTVQSVLAARIDRLGSEDKRLLQTAAVVGKDVPFRLLQAIAGLPEHDLHVGLDRLRAAEFMYESGLFPELEYTFKHALTHEVAYGSLLQGRRRELHGQIVAAIECVHGERLEEHIERLAHHAVQAELGGRAVHYLREAGRRAGQRSPAEARNWLEQALGVLATLSRPQEVIEQEIDVRIDLRRVLGQLGEPRQGLQVLREAETMCRSIGDELRLGRVSAAMAGSFLGLAEYEEALAAGTRALEIAERRGDLRIRIPTTSTIATICNRRGEFARAIELLTQNIATLPVGWLYEHFGNVVPPAVGDRFVLSSSLAVVGRFPEAARLAAECVRIAEPTRHAYAMSMAYWAAAAVHFIKGDWSEALIFLERCIATARAGSLSSYLPRALAASAVAMARMNQSAEALDFIKETEALLAQDAVRGVFEFQGPTLAFLGRASLHLGELDDAERFGSRALELSVHRRPSDEAAAHRLLADIAAHPARFDAAVARGHYREALALSEPRGMRPNVAHSHFGLGSVYKQCGLREESQKQLALAIAMYREMDMRVDLARAEPILEELGGNEHD